MTTISMSQCITNMKRYLLLFVLITTEMFVSAYLGGLYERTENTLYLWTMLGCLIVCAITSVLITIYLLKEMNNEKETEQ